MTLNAVQWKVMNNRQLNELGWIKSSTLISINYYVLMIYVAPCLAKFLLPAYIAGELRSVLESESVAEEQELVLDGIHPIDPVVNSRAGGELVWDSFGEELVVDAELYVAAAVAAKSSVDAITEVRFGSMRRAPDGSPRHAARITVCYPCAGESLWSVSKRYGVDPVRVATDNGIEADAPDSAESLANVGFLIV